MTFAEFCLRALAYERKELREWDKVRWLGLKIWEPHLKENHKLTVFDLLPLPGDPSLLERRQASKKSAKEQVAKGMEKIKLYAERGLLTLNNAPTTDAPTTP